MGYDGDKSIWVNRRTRSVNTCIGEVLYAPGGSCGPRVEKDYLLVFLHSGEFSVSIDGTRHEVLAGHAGLLLPGSRERFLFSKTMETHHSWCAVSPDFMPVEWREALKTAPPNALCSPTMDQLLRSGLGFGSVQTPAASRAADCIALALFGEYLHIAEGITSAKSGDFAVLRAIGCMKEHLASRDCLRRAHAAAGISRNVLITRFRRDFHATPARYLWRLRTERGIQMLMETGLTIAEIAYRCGFQTPFHFSRLATRLQGIPPRQIRRQAWGV